MSSFHLCLISRIRPVTQKAGLLAAEVIAKKDLEKAISDRAEWRADERRWCREGKLPKCGWWPQEEAPIKKQPLKYERK